MRSHYLSGRETRDALVRGDLEDARARFQRLSREPGPSDAPPSWEPRLEAMRQAAREAVGAQDLPEATRAFAQVAMRCAECHSALGVTAELESIPLPEGESPPAQMVRHQWAAEQMWQGLIGPDPERYRQGAAILAEAPLHPLELQVGTSPPLAVVQAAERARELAGRASRADADEAVLYGELLATCAACHGQLGAR